MNDLKIVRAHVSEVDIFEVERTLLKIPAVGVGLQETDDDPAGHLPRIYIFSLTTCMSI